MRLRSVAQPREFLGNVRRSFRPPQPLFRMSFQDAKTAPRRPRHLHRSPGNLRIFSRWPCSLALSLCILNVSIKARGAQLAARSPWPDSRRCNPTPHSTSDDRIRGVMTHANAESRLRFRRPRADPRRKTMGFRTQTWGPPGELDKTRGVPDANPRQSTSRAGPGRRRFELGDRRPPRQNLRGIGDCGERRKERPARSRRGFGDTPGESTHRWPPSPRGAESAAPSPDAAGSACCRCCGR
jgi:hypothetical protein